MTTCLALPLLPTPSGRGAFSRRASLDCRQALLNIALTLLLSLLVLLASVLLSPRGLLGVRAAEPPLAMAEELWPAGLFFLAGREAEAFEAPLLESEVAISVSGRVARVGVVQHFRNPSQAWLEGIYVFPLPERSAVDRLTMTVGDRQIEGRILEREEARAVYEQAAAEGRKASLLTSERPNVFVTSVANVGPGEQISIAIEYQDSVAYRDGRFELRFPMVVAPRYTPAPGQLPLVRQPVPAPLPSPEAQPIADFGPVQLPEDGRDFFGPVARPGEGRESQLSLSIALDAGLPLAEVFSPSHRIAIEAEGEARRLVALADESVPADRDFVLQWRPAQGAEPEAALFAEEIAGDSYLLVSLLPPPPTEAVEAPPPRDLILVVDTSGSMHGESLAAAQEALDLTLARLRPEDRFNLIRFADDARALFPTARAADPAMKRLARRAVAGLEAEGGTEMLSALELALAEPAEPGRLRQVVFLTDGAVGNEAALFTLIAERLGESRLFTVGIGSAPNGYFMRKAAELGRGSFTYIARIGQVSERMAGLLQRLEQPVLTGLAVTGPFAADSEIYPMPLPDLYAGEPVEFAVKLPGQALDGLGGSLVVTGLRGAEPWRRDVSLAALQPGAGVAQLWARSKLERIEDGLAFGRDPAEVRSEALALALHHGLVGRYTSLVAVDDRVSRPEGAPLVTEEQPRALPEGWDYDKVFGEAQRVMPLRALPASLLREASLEGQSIALAQGATPAQLQALIGLVLLALGGLLLLLVARREHRLA